MRTKQEVLSDAHNTKPKTPDWDVTASTHERLTIEVLLDIRDQFALLVKNLASINLKGYRAP